MPPFDPSDLHDLIRDEIRRAGPFASMEEIQRRLNALNETYNNAPQDELGGLSPSQMGELFSGDWRSTGALRLDSTIGLHDLAVAPLLVDARTLLQYVADNGPIKLTPAGNLPRSAVNALLPQLRTDALNDYPRPPTVNEGDVLWLVVLRNVLLMAKLLVRRRGLVISKHGRSLLDEQRAGELFTLVFETFFRTLDLRFLDNSDRHPRLQWTVPFSFYHLRAAARDWTSPQTLAERAWHPDAKDPPSPHDLQFGDLRYIAFAHRVLNPLVQFGLMQRRAADAEARWAEYEYRITPLFNRFMRFEFGKQ